MHITLESDYAVRIVAELVSENSRLDAKTIADRTAVSLRFALKILRKLVAKGIIKSFKGAQGGYELAKPSSEISLREVIETVEGTYALSRCLQDSYLCTRGKSGNCCYQKVFCEISTLVNDKLNEYTFDMLKEEKE